MLTLALELDPHALPEWARSALKALLIGAGGVWVLATLTSSRNNTHDRDVKPFEKDRRS